MISFVDETSIRCVAGKGGDGCIAFRREKYIAKGGPNGGDGGRGGSIVFHATHQASTLLDLARMRIYKADCGQQGLGKQCSGISGEDIIIRVPVGTIVREKHSDELIVDLSKNDQTYTIAKGGKGGLGNQHFATPTNQAPRKATPGIEGEDIELHLELKLIADVGLLGMPNAGKSTFLSSVSAARPRVASYPFTTLHPNLGIVDIGDYKQIVVADIPGLIAGAAEGAGLGVQFLRHVQRTKVMLHLTDLLPLDESDPAENIRILNDELKSYDEELSQRPQLVVGTKMDLPGAEEALEKLKADLAPTKVLGMSSVSRTGLKEVLYKLAEMVEGKETFDFTTSV